jgi:hypothetical protein
MINLGARRDAHPSLLAIYRREEEEGNMEGETFSPSLKKFNIP